MPQRTGRYLTLWSLLFEITRHGLVVSASTLPLLITCLQAYALTAYAKPILCFAQPGVDLLSTQADKSTGLLEFGRPVRQELRGGQSHSYQITIASGQYVLAIVHQKGIDVAVTLFRPDGRKILEVDSPNSTQGPESVSLVADTPGIYRLEVSSSEKDALDGSYEVKVEELRTATEKDKSRFAAQSKNMEALALVKQSGRDHLERAINKYREALPLFQVASDYQGEAYTLTLIADIFSALGDRHKALTHYSEALHLSPSLDDRCWEAYARNQIGLVYNSLGETQKGLDSYSQALSLWRAVNDSDGEARTLNNIAWVYNSLGEKQKALNHFKQALTIRRAMADQAGEADTLDYIASVYNSLGERQRALDYFNQALTIYHALGDSQGEGSALTQIGIIYSSLGDNQKALYYFNKALPIRRAGHDQRGEGYTLAHIARVYSDLGEKQQALDKYNQTLLLFRAMHDSEAEAGVLNSIGLLYLSLGENLKALDYFNEAFPLITKAGKKKEQARVLNNIGRIYAELGNKQKALDSFNTALQVFKSVDDRIGKGEALNNIGRIYSDSREDQKALSYYEQALEIIRAVGDRRKEATILDNIGTVYRSLGDKQRALISFNQSLRLSRSLGYRSGEVSALYHIAKVERDRANLIEARALIDAALEIVESIRTRVDIQELRASYFASIQDYYGFNIDLLMQMHKLDPSKKYDRAALQVNERARARTFLDILAESNSGVYKDIDAGLLERKRALHQQLNTLAARQMRLPDGKTYEEQTTALAKEISATTTEYQQVEAQIRARSPHYRMLTQPQPLTVEGIQQLLDSETLLLEYALGKDRSYMWAVTSDSMTSFELRGREDIEVIAQRLLQLLTARNQFVKFETAEEKVARVANADDEYAEVATALSEMILGPVAHIGKRRLLIVSDGALQYIPFAVLLTPEKTSNGKATNMKEDQVRQHSKDVRVEIGPVPLFVNHEIVSLPSATTLAMLRSEVAGRKPAPRTLAVFADPVFSKDDDRLRDNRNSSQQNRKSSKVQDQSSISEREVDRSARESGAGDVRFVRLFYTRQEAEAILVLVPPAERKEAFDFQASRATATSAELGQYRLVHFATHGFLNNLHPELSGIVLSLVDREGANQDGFLRAIDIFNLKLPAELIVVSGCRTGLGKDIRGEGLVGLTRAFMYAGAARVLVSLWNVNDEGTAELMKRFYRNLLGKQGLRPAKALSAAQLSMWKEKRWRSPYYWAAFILQGEPR